MSGRTTRMCTIDPGDRLFSGKSWDKLFNRKPTHRAFYDGDGLIKGCVWVVFKNFDKLKFGIQRSKMFGDLMMGFDAKQGKMNNRSLRCVAIPCGKRPEDIQQFIFGYFSKVGKAILVGSVGLTEQQESVYTHLLERLEGHGIEVVETTMEYTADEIDISETEGD